MPWNPLPHTPFQWQDTPSVATSLDAANLEAAENDLVTYTQQAILNYDSTWAASTYLQGAHNLSDIADAGSARANIHVPILTPAQVVATSNVALSGLQTIDGYTLVANDLVLLTGQTSTVQNGLWTASSGAWTRPTEFASGISTRGRICPVINGASNSLTTWLLDVPTGTITIGTDPQTWALLASGGTPHGTATGDLTGTYPNPTVSQILGTTPTPHNVTGSPYFADRTGATDSWSAIMKANSDANTLGKTVLVPHGTFSSAFPLDLQDGTITLGSGPGQTQISPLTTGRAINIASVSTVDGTFAATAHGLAANQPVWIGSPVAAGGAWWLVGRTNPGILNVSAITGGSDTFTILAVDTAAGWLTLDNAVGVLFLDETVTLSNTGGVLPTGFVPATTYYVNAIDTLNNAILLATTPAAGGPAPPPVIPTDSGSGTNTMVTTAGSMTIANHGLVENQPIQVYGASTTKPPGTDAQKTYYTHRVDANTIQLKTAPQNSTHVSLNAAVTGLTVCTMPPENVFYVVPVDADHFKLSLTANGTALIPQTSGSNVTVYTTAWRYLQDYPENYKNVALIRLNTVSGLSRYDTAYGGTGRLSLRDLSLIGNAALPWVNALLDGDQQPVFKENIRISGFRWGYGRCVAGSQHDYSSNVLTNQCMDGLVLRGATVISYRLLDSEQNLRRHVLFEGMTCQPVALSAVNGTTFTTALPHNRQPGDQVRLVGVGSWPTHAYPTYSPSGLNPAASQISPGGIYSIVNVPSSTTLMLADTAPAIDTIAAPSSGTSVGSFVGATTTVASASNGIDVTTFTGTGTLNAASTTNYPSSGVIEVPTTGGLGSAVIAYAGKTGTAFTNCSLLGGSGTLATNSTIVQALSVPSTSGFTTTGTMWVQTSTGVALISYTGLSNSVAFTGCTTLSGTGLLATGGSVTQAGQEFTLSSLPPGLTLEWFSGNSTGGSSRVWISQSHHEGFTTHAYTVDPGDGTHTTLNAGKNRDGSLASHYLHENEAIRFRSAAAPLLSDKTTYYVHVVDGSRFQVALTPGGTPISGINTSTTQHFTRGHNSVELHNGTAITDAESTVSLTGYADYIKVYLGAGQAVNLRSPTAYFRNLFMTEGSGGASAWLSDDNRPLRKVVSAVNIGTGALTITSHNLPQNLAVQVVATTLPTGLTANQWYFVQVVDTNTIQLATTPGGNPVIPATTGSQVTIQTAHYSVLDFGREVAMATLAPLSQTATGINSRAYGLYLPLPGGGFTRFGSGQGSSRAHIQASDGQTSDLLTFSNSLGVVGSGVAAPDGHRYLNTYDLITTPTAAPSAPASGTRALYTSPTTGKLSVKRSDGTEISLEEQSAALVLPTNIQLVFAAASSAGITGVIPAAITVYPNANGGRRTWLRADLTNATQVRLQLTNESTASPLTLSITAVNTSNGNLTITAHGLANNQPVALSNTGIPAGYTTFTTTYVIVVDANTIQLAATPGGAAIVPTTTGSTPTLSPVSFGIQYSSDQANWTWLDGSSGTSGVPVGAVCAIGTVGLMTSAWFALPLGAKGEFVYRVVSFGGNSTVNPTITGIRMGVQ